MLRLTGETIGDFEGVDLPVDETIELVEKYSADYVKGMYLSFNLKIGGKGENCCFPCK